MDIYEKNIQSLKNVDSQLLPILKSVKPNDSIEVFVGKDCADINFLDKKKQVFLFNGSGLEFNVNKVKEFNQFALYPYLYFFGLGNGIFYKIILTNKNIERIIVIEPNLEIIFSVLNLVDLTAEIESRRIVIMHSKDVNFETLSVFFFQNKHALIYSKLYNLHIFNQYYDFFIDEATKINKLFVEIIEHGVTSIGNDSKDAIIGIKQHIANMPLMLKLPTLIELIKNGKNTNVAVIASTGPSLYKQLDLLKEVQQYVTIFCIDASFPILSNYGIKPDIVLSLERVKESAKFYKEVDKKHFKDVIFEITSIAHEELINTILDKQGILQISQRPFGYTNYFGFHEYGYIGIGMSAANMAYELVVHCGFSQCILIGQDLAFGEDGVSHSKGAVYGEKEIKKDQNIVHLPKYGGNGLVESTKIWKMFWNFFIKDINDTKDRITVINATQGGARIYGTKEMSFEDALRIVDRKKIKNKITLTKPDPAKALENIKNAKKHVMDILKYGRDKKAKIEKLFLIVAKQTDILEALNKENRLDEFDFQGLDSIFNEIEKIKGLFKNKKFTSIFNEATQAYIFHQEMELAKIITRECSNQTQINAKKIEWLFAHKTWLFSLAGCIDSVLFCINDSFKNWES